MEIFGCIILGLIGAKVMLAGFVVFSWNVMTEKTRIPGLVLMFIGACCIYFAIDFLPFTIVMTH